MSLVLTVATPAARHCVFCTEGRKSNQQLWKKSEQSRFHWLGQDFGVPSVRNAAVINLGSPDLLREYVSGGSVNFDEENSNVIFTDL